MRSARSAAALPGVSAAEAAWLRALALPLEPAAPLAPATRAAGGASGGGDGGGGNGGGGDGGGGEGGGEDDRVPPSL